jgi:putative cardiolipin synthase
LQASFRQATSIFAALLVCSCTALRPVEKSFETQLPPVKTGLWAELAKERASPWFHLLNTGEESLVWRLRAIDAATSSIDLETFLWKSDRSGARLLARLLAAADRGVRVRILLDDSFTAGQDLAWRAVSEHPNVLLRIYNPLSQRSGGMALRQLANLGEFSRVDHRLHNKVFLIDGRLAIVGGRNLADEYFGYDGTFNFRDLDVMTLDGSVREMANHFDAFWNSAWTFPIDHFVPELPRHRTLADVRAWLRVHAPDAPQQAQADVYRDWLAVARIAHRGRSRFVADEPAKKDPSAPEEAPEQVAMALLELIDQAESEMIVVSAYLIPTEKLEAAVARAEKRGVRVRVLTNSLRSNNHLAAHAAYRRHIERLIRHGADLHEMRAIAKDRERYMAAPVAAKRLGLHAKLLVVDDDRVYIGSCNLDPRSLRINTEVGLVIESADLNRALRDVLAIDFDPRNAWALRPATDGKGIVWVGDDQVLTSVPADSPMQRLEDWLLSILPLENEL